MGLFAVGCFSQPAAAQQNQVNVRTFLPTAAVVEQELSLDLQNDGIAAEALVYTVPDKSDDVYHTEGVQVLKHSPVSGWVVVFDEAGAKMGANDYTKIERLRASNGKEALLIISYYSGAGTATTWDVLASINGKITKLDPTRERAKVLNTRDYVDNGYNHVTSKGDLVVENLSGYSRHRARCCPNRPSLEMSFKFTGSAITLDSVKELPYGVPTGSHGPLLRLSGNGLWAYGYDVPDGFLVLGGSESPARNAPLTPPSIVALRKSLLDQEILADAGDHLVLAGDYKFTSQAAAAGVMLARRPKGQSEWRDESGKPVAAR